MDPAYFITTYLAIFSLILFGYYLIPAGLSYFVFYVWKKEEWKSFHIQKNHPTRKSISREIRWSLVCVVILALLSQLLYELNIKGYTRMYDSVGDFGWVYLIGSSLFTIIAYDTYFYWLHRFMHLKSVFPIIHKTHHLSHAPSPFATLAFSPLESALEFAIIPILVFLIPLHPIALGVFVAYNIILNTGGHLGFEIIPIKLYYHPVMKLSLTVTHHEMHHSKTHCNYGIYFNLWDRIMKTNHPDYEKTYLRTQEEKSL
jgi:sterol desaturase/sphingolipid hydroxylase (fatty acid hydroxylase superfamily)